MRIAVIADRLVVSTARGFVDVATGSEGRFGPDPMSVYPVWGEFRDWVAGADLSAEPVVDGSFEAVVPRPAQVFGVGLNYRLHALESGLAIPQMPLVFTKFPSSVAAPSGEVRVYTDQVDWEVELAVVIGTAAHGVSRDHAWEHVAGFTLAQDFSARDVQLTPPGTPQFSLGKSFPGYLPLGPTLATLDEFADPSDVGLWCEVDGVRLQDGRTNDLIFPVPVVIEYLSSIVTLLPGDVILTGTPSGVGFGMTPQRFLQAGEVVRTGMEVVGEMRHVAVAPPTPWTWTA